MATYCKVGVVKEVWLENGKVYIIHSPAFTESAQRRQQELMEEGYDVIRLNTGIKEEAEWADELLGLCLDP